MDCLLDPCSLLSSRCLFSSASLAFFARISWRRCSNEDSMMEVCSVGVSFGLCFCNGWSQALKLYLVDESKSYAPPPKHCSSKKTKKCGSRVCLLSSCLPQSRAKEGPCQVGMNRLARNLANDEQLLRPTSSIRPDAVVTTFRTTYNGASAVVAPEYLPLDTLEPHSRSRKPSHDSSTCLPPLVSTYALPFRLAVIIT